MTGFYAVGKSVSLRDDVLQYSMSLVIFPNVELTSAVYHVTGFRSGSRAASLILMGADALGTIAALLTQLRRRRQATT